MTNTATRRDLLIRGLAGATALATSGTGASRAEAAADRAKPDSGTSWPICLNTSTIRAHKLPLMKIIDVAADAGYQGLEIWVDEIDRHLQAGGTLDDVDKALKDRKLLVTGAIAFFEWMVDDDARRAKGIEAAKQHMGRLAEIGATHIAAPPCGDVQNVDLLKAAERYRQLLNVGDGLGVTPAVEIWGPAKNLYRLGQAVMVAIEADHPKACILPDVYHLYKGGSGLNGVALLSPNLLAGFHLNDYPKDPPREAIRDKDRVYPGDGIAPLGKLIRDLRSIGYRGPLSVELFNPEYARQDPNVVARTALAKTRQVIAAGLSG
ncbi:MAG: sugar phosphate isomerase/epimerase [Phycisphaerae bacterium]|nr:sugar phosphate isomerase/epimerase [Phycisphaerae bacterium]